ncbi:oligosaccharide flippase family protein [Actinoplanes sp. NPDC026619]|uniref:lipopolysaccharide biosynthesis protein n=1 Tax=Actinoplanes sp. NPDC026619 TaxID=3155798 RepID=UPI0033DCB1C6
MRRARAAGPRDVLVDNSFFILATSVVTGAGGFLFWTLSARLFTPAQVGLASALLGACGTLALCSLLGLNQTLVRRLPGNHAPSRLINTSLLLITGASIVVAAGYALIVPSFVPALGALRGAPMFLAFVLVTVLTAVNVGTDAVFVAHQRARFNFAIDGLLQITVKLVVLPALVWLGAYGVFFSAGIATAAAVATSLIVLVRRFSYRPRPEVDGGAVRRDLAFSSRTYVAELFDLVPPLVLPLLIVQALGPQETAYFLIAFQIANLLYAGIFAVTQATFAEGCRHPGSLRALAGRSARMLLLAPVGGLVLAGVGPYLLGVVGPEYRAGGAGPLVVLSLGAVVVAPTALSAALLKLTGQLGALVAATALRNGIVCLLAVLLMPHGLIGVAIAYVGGEAISLVIPAWALLRRSVWKVRA